jgi:hypothetical protein
MPPVGEVNCGYWKPDTSSNGNWIPCSDRIPDTGSMLILSTVDKLVRLGFYSRHSDTFYGLSILNDDAVKFEDGYIIAWMPMPKAYDPPERK